MCGIQDVKAARTISAWKVLAECTCMQTTTIRSSVIAFTIGAVVVWNGASLYSHALIPALACLASWLSLAGVIAWWKRSVVAYGLTAALIATDVICRLTASPGPNALIWVVLWMALLMVPRQAVEQAHTHTHAIEAHTHGGETHEHHHLHLHVEHDDEAAESREFVETRLAAPRFAGELTSRQTAQRLTAEDEWWNAAEAVLRKSQRNS